MQCNKARNMMQRRLIEKWGNSDTQILTMYHHHHQFSPSHSRPSHMSPTAGEMWQAIILPVTYPHQIWTLNIKYPKPVSGRQTYVKKIKWCNQHLFLNKRNICKKIIEIPKWRKLNLHAPYHYTDKNIVSLIEVHWSRSKLSPFVASYHSKRVLSAISGGCVLCVMQVDMMSVSNLWPPCLIKDLGILK